MTRSRRVTPEWGRSSRGRAAAMGGANICPSGSPSLDSFSSTRLARLVTEVCPLNAARLRRLRSLLRRPPQREALNRKRTLSFLPDLC